MTDILKDDVFGEVNFQEEAWVGCMDVPVYNSDGGLMLVVQDDDKEGILDIQRKAYKTYLQNADRYKEIAVDYLLDYYKWNYEYIASIISDLDENDHKDVITETQPSDFHFLR